MESKRQVKNKLSRLFNKASTLPCNNFPTSTTSSSGIFTSSSSQITRDIAVDPVFLPHSNSSIGKGKGDNVGIEPKGNKNSTTRKKKKLLSNGYGFSSSESERSENFFSLRSFSSEDSFEFYRHTSSRKRKSKKPTKHQHRRDDAIPVTKRSKDPYVDFCGSMVEMIVERQIFGAKGLEKLLHSYLFLNSSDHHPVIVRAFADVSEVLFGCSDHETERGKDTCRKFETRVIS